MPLNYQWLKNCVGLSNGGKISGAKAETLNLAGVDQTDAANYSVIVTNVVGSIPSSPPATLIVIDPPAIVLQPTNRTSNAGEIARFTVSANGSSLHYQWKKGEFDLADGGNISGVNS